MCKSLYVNIYKLLYINRLTISMYKLLYINRLVRGKVKGVALSFDMQATPTKEGGYMPRVQYTP